MSEPRIAVPVPTSFDHEYNRRCWPQYAQAVERAGGCPVAVELSATPSEIVHLANSCNGVLLPGSPADVNPHKYGHAHDPATAAADPFRENVDELLLQDAHNLYKPILGVCYGAQSLNVWRGGTLVQDLGILPVNHEAGPGVAIAHSAVVERASHLHLLGFDSGTDERLPINSSHHQAVGVPGDGLRIIARCPQDGVVEAIEGGQAAGHFVLGVQWHPERSLEISEASRRLFSMFVQECAAWVPRLVTTSVAYVPRGT